MTHTVKTITVGHVTLELPTGMPSKEIQQLAGYLATLRRVESLGLFGRMITTATCTMSRPADPASRWVNCW
jgi:hypothetical protein